MKDVMVDIETLDTKPSAVILSIGAVAFDLEKQVLGEQFQVYISLEDNLRLGRTISESTMKFWLEQPEETRNQVFSGVMPLKDALHSFNSHYMWQNLSNQGVNVWGNGAAFDNVLLEDAYRSIGEIHPWKRWNNMCFRTLRAWFGIEEGDAAHIALDDAIQQAKIMLEIHKMCPRFVKGVMG